MPTPTPEPTFLVYVVVKGDSLNTIAHRFGTTARSIAFWNRSTYPSLDPEAPGYRPNRLDVGWTLFLRPNDVLDEQDLPDASDSPGPADSADPEQSPEPGTSPGDAATDDPEADAAADAGGDAATDAGGDTTDVDATPSEEPSLDPDASGVPE